MTEVGTACWNLNILSHACDFCLFLHRYTEWMTNNLLSIHAQGYAKRAEDYLPNAKLLCISHMCHYFYLFDILCGRIVWHRIPGSPFLDGNTENRPFAAAVFRWRKRQWQVRSARDFPPQINTDISFLSSFLLYSLFLHSYAVRIAAAHSRNENESRPHDMQKHINLHSIYKYCKIIKYTSIDFNSPHRVQQRIPNMHVFVMPGAGGKIIISFLENFCVRISFAPI